ncbi:MAG TPA: TerC family protein [Bacillales bacterium]|nr:TerC family protein [Bacillales bacterium]
MFDVAFWTGLLTIFLINIVMSGDNAVVIALASRNLPEKQRKKAIFWGSVGAIGLRVVLTFLVAWLLQIPFLKLIGGLLLIYIAYNLLNDDHEPGENIEGANGLAKAIQTVIFADLIMSLDNVLAIAGTAGDNALLIILGLAISIPLIIWGSNLLLKLMEKFPIIIWAGAGLLAWTAGEMINGDDFVHEYVEHYLGAFHWLVPLIITVGVLGISYLRQKGKKNKINDEGNNEENKNNENKQKAEG